VARMSWFDEKAEVPLIQEQVEKLESFTRALADGVVDREELEKQQERLITTMREVEARLSDELHEKVTRLLVELTAYDVMRVLHEIRGARAQAAFH